MSCVQPYKRCLHFAIMEFLIIQLVLKDELSQVLRLSEGVVYSLQNIHSRTSIFCKVFYQLISNTIGHAADQGIQQEARVH